MSIIGNAIGTYSPMGKTFTLVDENGTEITGVVVDQEIILTAGDNDVREGMVYASDTGVSTGTKNIPTYHTYEGYKVVPAGSEFKFVLTASDLDLYDYTKLQCIICLYNTSMANSVSANKVVIDSKVYEVNSTTALATVIKDSSEKAINLGITNNDSKPCIIRFFTYKEIE